MAESGEKTQVASDVFRRVLSWTREKLAKLVLLLVDCAAVTLLFPFQPVALVIVVALVGCALFTLWLASRGGRRRTKLLWGSAGLTVLAVTWGVAAPFMLTKEPIYVVYATPSTVTAFTEAREVRLASIGTANVVGSILVIMDPARKALHPVWHWLRPSLRRIEPAKTAGGFARLLLPVDARAPLDSTSRTAALLPVEVRGVIPGIALNLRGGQPLISPHIELGAATTTQVGSVFGPFPVNNASAERWEAVDAADPPRDNDLRYAAALDSTLWQVAFGTTEAAFEYLATARNIAPTPREEARATLLLAELTEYRLTGSVGRLQALALLGEAYSALASAAPDLGATRDQIWWWVAEALTLKYAKCGPAFANRVAALSKLIAGDQALRRSLWSMHSVDRRDTEECRTCPEGQILEAVHDSQLREDVAGVFAAWRRALDRIDRGQAQGYGQFLRDGGKELAGLSYSEFEEVERNLIEEGTESRVRQFIDTVHEESGSPISEDRVPRLIGRVQHLPELLHRLPADQALGYRLKLEMLQARRGAEAGVPKDDRLRNAMRQDLPHYSDQFDRIATKSERILPVLPRGAEPWWDYRYLDRVAYGMVQLEAKLADGPQLNRKDVEAAVGPVEEFVADGRGALFVPALAILARFTELAKDQFHNSLVRKLETVIGADYGSAIIVRENEQNLCQSIW